MDTIIDWSMGGHGKYIWSAFGFSALLFAGLAVHAQLQFNKQKKLLIRQYMAEIKTP